MNLDEFIRLHPELAFDFSAPISAQPRLYAMEQLGALPTELTPVYAYRSGSRGRPNLNQTRSHAQCATCKRVLRNDFFYAPSSLKRRNVLFPHCLECTQIRNAENHSTRTNTMRRKSAATRLYLGASCAHCGFDTHISALDLHHEQEKNERRVAALIDELAQAPVSSATARAEELLRMAQACVPLCANCHRMLHAGVFPLDAGAPRPGYDLARLLAILK